MSNKSNCELCLTSRNDILRNIKTGQLTYCAACSCLYFTELNDSLKSKIEDLILENSFLEAELRDAKSVIRHLTEELEYYKNL